tara:strand:- start:446 stop:760 length:315 start_codon:yes stop_codon:yes gene_type:complete
MKNNKTCEEHGSKKIFVHLMGLLRFTVTRKKRRWECPKDVKLCIDIPDKKTIRKTRKSQKENKKSLDSMDIKKKKSLLENNGVLKQNSKVPDDIVNIMISGLVE